MSKYKKQYHFVTFSLELKEKHRLESLAKHRGQSVSALMRDILYSSKIYQNEGLPDDMFSRLPYQAKKPDKGEIDMFEGDQ